MQFLVCRPVTLPHEAPNNLALLTDKPKGQAFARYKRSKESLELYSDAARLWAQGVEIQRAIRISRAAHDAAALARR